MTLDGRRAPGLARCRAVVGSDLTSPHRLAFPDRRHCTRRRGTAARVRVFAQISFVMKVAFKTLCVRARHRALSASPSRVASPTIIFPDGRGPIASSEKERRDLGSSRAPITSPPPPLRAHPRPRRSSPRAQNEPKVRRRGRRVRPGAGGEEARRERARATRGFGRDDGARAQGEGARGRRDVGRRGGDRGELRRRDEPEGQGAAEARDRADADARRAAPAAAPGGCARRGSGGGPRLRRRGGDPRPRRPPRRRPPPPPATASSPARRSRRRSRT